MPSNYYKILGLCCFIKDALLTTSEPGLEVAIRDRHLERYLYQINNKEFTYDYNLKPIEGADHSKEYARHLLIQFNRCIDYTCLNIHQNLETLNIWIDINQLVLSNPMWWRFDDRSEPALKEIKPIPKVVGTRNIIICK
jgi:hypothetical protein